MAPAENILEEALRITDGDRAEAYGDALADAQRFAQIASAVTGLSIEPEHFPLLMIAVKLSRASQGKYHRDSIVDIAGYARVAEKIQDRLGESKPWVVARLDRGRNQGDGRPLRSLRGGELMATGVVIAIAATALVIGFYVGYLTHGLMAAAARSDRR